MNPLTTPVTTRVRAWFLKTDAFWFECITHSVRARGYGAQADKLFAVLDESHQDATCLKSVWRNFK